MFLRTMLMLKTNNMKCLVSALEPSSNLHLRNIKKNIQNVSFIGICEKDLGDAIFDPSMFSIMGFSDFIPKLSFIFNALNILSKEACKCDVILLIDNSSFNLRLAKKIKKINPQSKIIYYILPQLWAWKAWRVKVVLSLCDKIACILPFEPSIYKNFLSKNKKSEKYTKIQNIHYVGHPLLDIYSSDINASNLDSKIFTFMPGSRNSEIKYLMPELLKLKEIIKKHFPEAVFRIILHLKFKDMPTEYVLNLYTNLDEFDIFYDTKEGLSNCSFAFICAGTATLEAALLKIPFILIFKTKEIDYFIGRLFIKLTSVGLVNILYQGYLIEHLNIKDKRAGFWDKNIHPEILQKDYTASNIFRAFVNFNYKLYFNEVSNVRTYLQNGSVSNIIKLIKEDFN